MEPALIVTLLWLLFGATHIGLATRRIRAALLARLGELGFTLFFSLIAAAAFTVGVRYYAAHRFDGVAGLALGDVTALRWVLMGLVIVGIVLAIAGVIFFPGSPMVLYAHGSRSPRGLERITRHPFFAGLALVALAHTLLATRLVGTAFFGGLTLFTIAGAWHQGRKLLALHGRAYAEYLAATSALPFGAVLDGRQQLAWRELPVAGLVAGLVLALVLRAGHGSIFSHGGAWVIGVTVGGAAILGFQDWRRARRTDRAHSGLAPRTV